MTKQEKNDYLNLNIIQYLSFNSYLKKHGYNKVNKKIYKEDLIKIINKHDLQKNHYVEQFLLDKCFKKELSYEQEKWLINNFNYEILPTNYFYTIEHLSLIRSSFEIISDNFLIFAINNDKINTLLENGIKSFVYKLNRFLNLKEQGYQVEQIVHLNNILETIKSNNTLFDFTNNFIKKYNDLPFLSDYIEKILIEKEKIILNNEIKIDYSKQNSTEKRKHKI